MEFLENMHVNLMECPTSRALRAVFLCCVHPHHATAACVSKFHTRANNNIPILNWLARRRIGSEQGVPLQSNCSQDIGPLYKKRPFSIHLSLFWLSFYECGRSYKYHVQ